VTPAASRIPAKAPPTVIRIVAAGVWLLFLQSPFLHLFHHPSGWRTYLGFGALVLFVFLYIATFVWFVGAGSRYPEAPTNYGTRWLSIGGLIACVLAMIPGAQDSALTGFAFVAAAGLGVLSSRQGWSLLAVLLAVALLATQLVPGWADNGTALAIVLAGTATWAFRMNLLRRRQLVMAERELGEMALQEERSRIARDLHDILGHSLTVIAVKTELAERLLDVDKERARAELHDLERLTRDALADVRSTAMGVRGIALPGEIAAARTALESAGIDPHLPTVTDEVPSRWRELFAWTVREAVTNVIRHSNAEHCYITMSDRRLTITDDGDGQTCTASDGRGLTGLRQRATLAGATLTVGRGPDGRGFSVSVEVPS